MVYKDRKPAEVKKGLTYEGVTFYPEAWKGKDLKEFLEHEKHHSHLTEDQLKEAWGLIQGKAKKADAGK